MARIDEKVLEKLRYDYLTDDGKRSISTADFIHSEIDPEEVTSDAEERHG